MTHQPLVYSIDEAAKITGMGKTKLYQELNAGRIMAIKNGKRTLITAQALQDWINHLTPYSTKSSAST